MTWTRYSIISLIIAALWNNKKTKMKERHFPISSFKFHDIVLEKLVIIHENLVLSMFTASELFFNWKIELPSNIW